MRLLLRAAAVLATTAALTAVPSLTSPAHAGQVGVVVSIKGAGKVTVKSGSIEDGPTVCDWTSEVDERAVNTCERMRNEEPLVATTWLRPEAAPGNWEVGNWSGCDLIEMEGDVPLCGLQSGAFSSVEKTPRISFNDTHVPEMTSVEVRSVPDVDRTFRFDFAADEGALECAFDSTVIWTPCSSGFQQAFGEGNHAFYVRATDPSGQSSAVSGYPFTAVDTQLIATPPALTNSTAATFGLTSTIASSYLCQLDDQTPYVCLSQRVGNHTAAGLGEGTHRMRVWGRHLGWSDQVPATHTWTVDTTAPQTTLTGGEVSGGVMRSTFTSEAGASFRCRVTGPGRDDAWAACTSPVTYSGLTAEGTYTFEVAASDAAGNFDVTPAGWSWLSTPDPEDPLDPGPGPHPQPLPTPAASAPETGPVTGPGKVRAGRKATYRLASPTPGAVLACQVRRKGAAPVATAWRACSPTFVLKTRQMKPGRYILYVRAGVGTQWDATPSTKSIVVRRSR
ncbi:hypothetical protein [Nocardioides daeguensis]|uniref:Ig-like domain-containing protein n=1 Tax=Nocardioides daeguensis TaxID=908359 RepID=A0ABP6UZS2_9ACTN|nr:hypothetical protein [Nocardioides daeguensis]MBV6728731.1 hypothetical protein [Nocardioides daeguensis]MCR1773659.1 hypothetical protein [Nocardioides daeguensis]